MTIRQKQSVIYEEQLVFETRILCQFLPLDFDLLDQLISPASRPIVLSTDEKRIRCKHERLQIVQEAKRQWLRLLLSAYEIRLQEYDVQYQQTLQQLESTLVFLSNSNGVIGLEQIKRYMLYYTDRVKQDVSKKMVATRRKLLHNRQRCTSAKGTVGVSPEPYLDLLENPFNASEWQQLMLGKFGSSSRVPTHSLGISRPS